MSDLLELFDSIYSEPISEKSASDQENDFTQIRLEIFLCYAQEMIQKNGFTPRGKASTRRPATADLALQQYLKDRAAGVDMSSRFPPKLVSFVRTARAWGGSLAGDDDLKSYLQKLGNLCLQDTIEDKDIGLAASLFSAFEQEARRQAEVKRNVETSQWIGTEKERIDLTVHVDDRMTVPSAYGPRYLYRFSTVDGQLAAWFTSPDKSGEEKVEVGKDYVIMATVKKHDVRENGLKVTIFTRVEILADLTSTPVSG